MSKRQTFILRSEDDEAARIKEQTTPKGRAQIILLDLDRHDGTTYRRLTDSLSAKNKTTLSMAPMAIGADTSDIDAFIVDLELEVTDDNLTDVLQLFKQYYKLVAPSEYISPDFTAEMRAFLEIGI